MRLFRFRISPALVVVLTAGWFLFFSPKDGSAAKASPKTVPEAPVLPQVSQKDYCSLILDAKAKPDSIMESYRDIFRRDEVTAFFAAIAGSDEIASHILANSDTYGVSPSLALALCWAESRFSVRALNKNTNTSIDRGLFQLNSNTFPDFEEEEFFDPRINIRYGVAHLKHCLNTAGSEVAALAMYNAGTNRVRSGGTPKKTLDYVSLILDFKQGVEELFYSECIIPWAMAALEADSSREREEYIPAEALVFAQIK